MLLDVNIRKDYKLPVALTTPEVCLSALLYMLEQEYHGHHPHYWNEQRAIEHFYTSIEDS